MSFMFLKKIDTFRASHWSPAGSSARMGQVGVAGSGCGAGGEGCLGLAAAPVGSFFSCPALVLPGGQ